MKIGRHYPLWERSMTNGDTANDRDSHNATPLPFLMCHLPCRTQCNQMVSMILAKTSGRGRRFSSLRRARGKSTTFRCVRKSGRLEST